MAIPSPDSYPTRETGAHLTIDLTQEVVEPLKGDFFDLYGRELRPVPDRRDVRRGGGSPALSAHGDVHRRRPGTLEAHHH